MPAPMSRSPRRIASALATAIALSGIAAAVCAGRARAETYGRTTATILPSMSPDRLDAKGAFTLTIRYGGSNRYGLPAPVRRSALRLPSGMTLYLAALQSCGAARLRAHGPRSCPARSRIGGGWASTEVHMGSQIVTEQVALSVFLGLPRGLQPSFNVLAEGLTPLDERVVMGGVVLPATRPYGEELVISIPPISTLPLEPDASVTSLSLTIGARRRSPKRHGQRQNAAILPAHCPSGGLPFAAEFTYADGSKGTAQAAIPCPR